MNVISVLTNAKQKLQSGDIILKIDILSDLSPNTRGNGFLHTFEHPQTSANVIVTSKGQ